MLFCQYLLRIIFVDKDNTRTFGLLLDRNNNRWGAEVSSVKLRGDGNRKQTFVESDHNKRDRVIEML